MPIVFIPRFSILDQPVPDGIHILMPSSVCQKSLCLELKTAALKCSQSLRGWGIQANIVLH